MWSWGANDSGQLGQNNTTYRSSPVQIGSLATWSQVTSAQSACFAIKTDGTLWSWGSNSYGLLGLNDAGYGTGRSSPVQVGALTNWLKISSGSGHCLAIKNDGTLWAWGNNASGRLGINNTSNRSSPVQVGALTTWLEISGSSNFSLAINTSGNLLTWGSNSDGYLGLGDTANRSSPTQVGSLTSWVRLAQCNSVAAFAIKKP